MKTKLDKKSIKKSEEDERRGIITGEEEAISKEEIVIKKLRKKRTKVVKENRRNNFEQEILQKMKLRLIQETEEIPTDYKTATLKAKTKVTNMQ